MYANYVNFLVNIIIPSCFTYHVVTMQEIKISVIFYMIEKSTNVPALICSAPVTMKLFSKPCMYKCHGRVSKNWPSID